MPTFKAKLRYSVVLEAEIEMEASVAMAALDAAREKCKRGELPEFQVVKQTEPHVVAVVEKTPAEQTQ
jgi:hypothetical protein